MEVYMIANTLHVRSWVRLIPAFFMLAALFAAITPRPAAADGAASTRNIILGAAAIAAGIIIYNNVQHKRMQHDTVVGYTRDGGTVYADGRIVYPNGNVLYTGNRNGQRCGYVANYPSCGGTPIAYYPRGSYSRGGDEDDRDRGDWGRKGHHGKGHAYGHHRHGGDGDDRGERGDQ
jgi:hypothetical protein